MADATNCATFLCDYVHTQFDPAHLLSELGFTLAFEGLEIVLFALLWKRYVRPWLDNRHSKFDTQHGLSHNEPVSESFKPRCLCPHNDTPNGPGTGTVSGYTPGCPVHVPPEEGCPNPSCGETWVKSFKGTHCESCGWTQPVIKEEVLT